MGRRDYKVTPTEWMPRGEVLSLDLPRPTAIWQGIPGEECFVHIYHEGQNQWLGRWTSAVKAPHPLRIDPPCERYSPCGGCSLMHLQQSGQLRARRALLVDALGEEGLGGFDLREMVSLPNQVWDFRHIAKLAVGTTEIGHVRLGAFGRNSRDIVAIPNCNVITPRLRHCTKLVSHHVIGHDIEPFDSLRGTGLLRYVVMRQSRANGDVILTLVASRRSSTLDSLAEALGSVLPEVVGIHLHLNDGPGNAIFLRDGDGVQGTRLLVGRPFIEERFGETRFIIGPGDFFQTNPAMAEKVYEVVVESLLPGRPLVDLYCGVGGMALMGARKAGWSLGVEELEPAVLRARENASLNGLPAEFISGVVEQVVPDLRGRLCAHRPNVVLDPARRGLENGVPALVASLDPGRVIYVSCNPRTMARDLAIFQGLGFKVLSITPFDMFPQTAHLECVAILDPPSPVAAGPIRSPRRKRLGKT